MENLHLGQMVRKLIERNNDSVKDAAKKLKESVPNLYKKLEKKDLGTDFLRTVAETYRVKLSYFLNDTQYNVTQSGGVNNNLVGEKNFNYNGGDSENLRIKLESCEKQNQLLLKQIELYEKLLAKG